MKQSKIFGLLILCLALLAFTYYVEIDGGEADLSGHWQSALDAWKTLDESLSFEEVAESVAAEAILSYGEEARFGPDLYSLTLQTIGDSRQTQVLVKPSARGNQRVLRHELGLLLGLSTARAGMMNPAISPDDSIELLETDANQLEATVNAAKEDLNRDGKVDFYDLAEFSKRFGSNDISSSADINEDGVVDQADLDLLRAAYSFSEPSESPPVDVASSSSFEEAFPADPEASESVNPEALDPDAAPDTNQEPTNPENTENPDNQAPTNETQDPDSTND